MKQMLLLIGLMIIVSGCSTTKGKVAPYMEVGVGFMIEQNSDWYFHTARPWTCKHADTFHAEIGLELLNDVTIGYRHQSGISCGGPINSKPELYKDEILLTKKWGGMK